MRELFAGIRELHTFAEYLLYYTLYYILYDDVDIQNFL